VITIKSAGDAALLLVTGAQVADRDQDGNEAAALAAAIRAADLPGVVDVVPGASTILVSFEPRHASAAGLARDLHRIEPQQAAALAGAGHADIDVVYDGPDLALVASVTGLTEAEVIERHQRARYRVGWLGFSPGFGYLTGLDPVLAAVPRRDSPRLAVPAGSVAIAGGLAAVYPAASPGGWQLLGRSAARLWDAGADPPALLAAGMTVRFRALDSLPRDLTAAAAVAAAASPPVRASPPASQVPAVDSAHQGARLVQVLQPGPLTTVQDLGRPGLAHLGVPGSGAADAASLRRANRSAGNDDGAACLEVTLGRLALRFDCDAIVAITGASMPARLTTADGEQRDLSMDAATPVPAGSVLRLGASLAGLRAYLAIDGGFDVPPVLGSRSADLLSGLGQAPLRPGDWLRAGRPRSRPENRGSVRPRPSRPPLAPPGGEVRLQAIAGPRDDWFSADAIRTLTSGSYLVTTASDRTGLRLAGPPLARARQDELPSEGLATGSLQVTHDGQPILLLADHPVTGGYPVIAVVIAADLASAAQLRPGQQVRFGLSQQVPGRR
jgi:KipI family sensor histidine kinase inhibitor